MEALGDRFALPIVVFGRRAAAYQTAIVEALDGRFALSILEFGRQTVATQTVMVVVSFVIRGKFVTKQRRGGCKCGRVVAA